MKLKNGFVLQQIAGDTVVLPADSSLDMNMMITLNGTGRFLWEQLENETTQEALVVALLAAYEVDRPTAEVCVADFVKKLVENDFLA